MSKEYVSTGGAVQDDPFVGLLLDPPNELSFKGPFDDYVTVSLSIRNPTEKRIAFKIKTTAPKRYCVKPNSGVLDPTQLIKVNVLLQPFEYDPNEKNKHKFMVQYLYLNDEEIRLSVNEILNMWKYVSSFRLLDLKLRCLFKFTETEQQKLSQQHKKNEQQTRNTSNLVSVTNNHKPLTSLEQLLCVTQSKLSEAEEKVLTLERKLATANLKIEQLEEKDSKLSIDNSTIEKLLAISTAVFSNFATKEILNNITLPNSNSNSNASREVLLSNEYLFRIPFSLSRQLKAFSLNEKTTSTALYRILIKHCFQDLNVLANANAETLCESHKIVYAARDFIQTLRPNFDDKNMTQCLSELTCEARQYLWAKDNKSMFKAKDKIYKFNEKGNNTPNAKIKFEPSIIPNQPINNFHQQQYYQKPHTQQSEQFHQPLLYQQITQFQQLTTFQQPATFKQPLSSFTQAAYLPANALIDDDSYESTVEYPE